MKSKHLRFVPGHEVKIPSPLGIPSPLPPYEDGGTFSTAQQTPHYGSFGAGEKDEVPQTPFVARKK